MRRSRSTISHNNRRLTRATCATCTLGVICWRWRYISQVDCVQCRDITPSSIVGEQNTGSLRSDSPIARISVRYSDAVLNIIWFKTKPILSTHVVFARPARCVHVPQAPSMSCSHLSGHSQLNSKDHGNIGCRAWSRL